MKKNLLLRKFIPVIVAIFLISLTFGVGFYFGKNQKKGVEAINNVINKEDPLNTTKVDFNDFWRAWNILNEKYVSPDEITDQDKVWSAIQGLASSYKDPYTVFMPPAESEMFNEDIQGSFSGVGMEIGIREGIITVVSPLKNTPAEKAGIKPGDKIIKIDEQITSSFSTDQAVKLIRGEKGTAVKLTISREGIADLIEISVVRDNINIPTIDTEKREDVFIISLYNFSATSPNLFRDALREFVESKTNKLVLDLRGNPGGYLEAAVDMASWFLPAGKVIVTEDYGADEEDKVHRSKGYNIFNNNLKFVILVNGGSASASEILAGALKEHGIAKIVGTKTFGKGSVQELINLTPDTSLKITVAKWLTPNGNSISNNGLEPDVNVEITQEQFEDGLDPQLDKAIELLR